MRYLISIAYDGSKFYGFQRLNNKDTVQKKIEDALSKIAKEPIEIKGAGRTDRGVHALDQKASFDLSVNINEEHLKLALNSLVKPYIYINSVKKVNDDFHARFSTLEKTYIYKINLGEYNPLTKDYVTELEYTLDIDKMKECAKVFIGAHNFKNFVAGERKSYDCIIYSIDFQIDNDILEIIFKGKSFYRYMVRNLVGAMLDVSKKSVPILEVKEALNKPEIKKQFTTAPREGLYLANIKYEVEE